MVACPVHQRRRAERIDQMHSTLYRGLATHAGRLGFVERRRRRSLLGHGLELCEVLELGNLDLLVAHLAGQTLQEARGQLDLQGRRLVFISEQLVGRHELVHDVVVEVADSGGRAAGGAQDARDLELPIARVLAHEAVGERGLVSFTLGSAGVQGIQQAPEAVEADGVLLGTGLEGDRRGHGAVAQAGDAVGLEPRLLGRLGFLEEGLDLGLLGLELQDLDLGNGELLLELLVGGIGGRCCRRPGLLALAGTLRRGE